MRRALGGEEDGLGGLPAPRPSAFRWLMVWLLLAGVYLVVRLAARWLLSDEGLAQGGFPGLDDLDLRELAVVPAVEALALALLAELRRAVKESPPRLPDPGSPPPI